jgi:hypothetical protein
MSFLNLCALLCVAFGLVGCAGTGSGPTFALRQPKPDEAIVYHYRTSAVGGSARAYDVVANGQLVTRIGKAGFFEQSVAPGLISYQSKISYHTGPIGWGDNIIINKFQDFKEAYSFQAEPGKVYFLRWKAARNDDLPIVTLVPQADAIQDLSELKSFSPAKEQ